MNRWSGRLARLRGAVWDDAATADQTVQRLQVTASQERTTSNRALAKPTNEFEPVSPRPGLEVKANAQSVAEV